jgi:hypothetical protein
MLIADVIIPVSERSLLKIGNSVEWSWVEFSWTDRSGPEGLSFVQSSVCVVLQVCSCNGRRIREAPGVLVPSLPALPRRGHLLQVSGRTILLITLQNKAHWNPVGQGWGRFAYKKKTNSRWSYCIYGMLCVADCRMNKIECEEVHISIPTGAHKTPEYLSKWWWWW